MSDFVQQQSVECRFESFDSWVILSPIEQSIKRKIESVGTPLKDWDIQINYGIKTGFNDAFIISTEKRNEILDNCSSEEERTKTAELIRPSITGYAVTDISAPAVRYRLAEVCRSIPARTRRQRQGTVCLRRDTARNIRPESIAGVRHTDRHVRSGADGTEL